MKTRIISIVLLLSTVAFAQFNMESPNNNVPKQKYDYIVIYRTWEQTHVSHGDSFTFKYDWVNYIEGFNTLKQLMEWLNSSLYLFVPDKQKRTRLTEDELIAVYDLTKAEKIELQFISKNKSLPKRIEVQEEKWVDTEWRTK